MQVCGLTRLRCSGCSVMHGLGAVAALPANSWRSRAFISSVCAAHASSSCAGAPSLSCARNACASIATAGQNSRMFSVPASHQSATLGRTLHAAPLAAASMRGSNGWEGGGRRAAGQWLAAQPHSVGPHLGMELHDRLRDFCPGCAVGRLVARLEQAGAAAAAAERRQRCRGRASGALPRCTSAFLFFFAWAATSCYRWPIAA